MSCDWEAARFGDLFALPQRNGLNRPSRVRGSGLPMVNMGELFAHARIHDITMDLVPFTERESAFLLQKNDLLFARQSLVLEGAGKCSIFLGHKTTVFESHLIRCRLDESKHDPLFYFYFFSSSTGKAVMRRIIEQGAGAAGIRGSDLVELRVPCPPLTEQTRISRVLGALDLEAENLKSQNAALVGIAEAMFRSWFVKFEPVTARLAALTPEGCPESIAAQFPQHLAESSLGTIPEGWSVGCLGDIAFNSRAQAQPAQISSGTPYVGLEHVPRRSLALASWGASDEIGSGKFRFQRNDVLFGKLRPYFHKVVLAPFAGVCSTDILVVRPLEEAWLSFLTMHMFSTEFVSYTTQLSDGVRMPRTNWKDMAAYRVPLPPASLAGAFHSKVSPLLGAMLLNIETSQTLMKLRAALAEGLFSGKLSSADAASLATVAEANVGV